MKKSNWTTELIEQVRQRWIAGETSTQIGLWLCENGHPFSRSAVIAKMRKLGVVQGTTAAKLKQQSKPQKTPVLFKKSFVLEPQQAVVPLPSGAVQRRSKEGAESYDHVRAALPFLGVHHARSLHIPLLELIAKEQGSAKCCRWPTSHFDRRETLYCAAPIDSDQKGQYCSVHQYRLKSRAELTDDDRRRLRRDLNST
jgi:hypothetical protein